MKHAEWNREVMNHATIVYQRRHRNWALKRARGGLLLQNGIYVLSDLWEKRAHKAEAEVERLVERVVRAEDEIRQLQAEVERLKKDQYLEATTAWQLRAEEAEAEVMELKKILHRISDELTPHKVPPGADHTTVVDHIISMCNRALFKEIK